MKVLIAALTLSTVLLAGAARAHPLAPSSLRLTVAEDGTVEVFWRFPSFRPAGQQPLTPRLPSHCRPVNAPQATMSADRAAIEERWRVDCGERGLIGSAVSVERLHTTSTNVVVEVSLADGSSARALLHRGETSFVVPEGQRAGSVAAAYLRLGVEHLLTGLDHVLFVVGLLLLLRAWRKLAQAITAFTLGHSLSLSLAALGFVRIPQSLVEIAIAASIMVLALDVAGMLRTGRAGPVARWPWAICTAFGLLHGLGFAGALTHAGLPAHAIPLSLVCFNVGIEVGQLLIVGMGLGAWLVLRRGIGNRLRLTSLVPAYALGSMAAYWILQRGLVAIGVL